MTQCHVGWKEELAFEELAHQHLHHIGSLEGTEGRVVLGAEYARIVANSAYVEFMVIQADVANVRRSVSVGVSGAAGAEIALNGGAFL